MGLLSSKHRKRKIAITLVSLFLVLVTAVGAVCLYVGDYYRPDKKAVEAFSYGSPVTERELKGGLAFLPEDPQAGFIFYPGGKVEYTAYKPLMTALAEKGVLCVLLKMPLNLAVLDVNAAEGVQEDFPEIDRWYIGGHSLGGSMAASYISSKGSPSGLVLLGAYSTADLTKGDCRVLSVYGSEDGVLNREKYEKYRSNLPDGFTERVIEGGCHAYFGMYGRQDGDGEPSISPEEQVHKAAEIVAEFILN